MSYTGSLFNFINNSTSSFHTVLNAQSYLIKNGFEEVNFSEDWQLKADKKYFTKIYDSTLIAFIPHQNLREGMKIAVSHTDFPCLKIKPSADIMQNDYGKLNVEIYGGMILNTWFDRPLSIAGKVVLKGQDCYQPDARFVDFKRPLMIIPNLAIHMDRSINSGKNISKQKEMLPLAFMQTENNSEDELANDNSKLIKLLAEELSCAQEDILSYDLTVYQVETRFFR